MKLKPIITSLLDTDFYKFNMNQVIFHKHTDLVGEYHFKCRTPGIEFTEEMLEEINEQTDFENVTNSVGYLASVKNFKFKRLVTAGDQLKIICELQSSLRSLIRVNAIIQDENGKEVASGDMLIAKG